MRHAPYLSRQLEETTGQTLTDPDALRQDLRETQRLGYAVSNGETYEGVTGIGAAFFWGSGRPAGSLAVAMPIHRATSEAVSEIGALLKAACDGVTALLSAEGQDNQKRETP